MTDPRWLKTARSYIGLTEVPGLKSNSTIIGWLAKLGAWWREDSTPWCGTFVAAMLQEAGLPFPVHYYRAKAWADYGSLLRRDRLSPGAILVFDRQGGGHVGFYAGEDAAYYFVLGGNQSNGVNVMKIAKSRCIATRWPKGEPVIGKPVFQTGGKVSHNER